MKTKINFLVVSLLIVFASYSQHLQILSSIDLPKVRSTKSGPYIGFQKGKYNLIEFGGELQHKKITLTHPKTNAFRFGMVYDFKENNLGFDLAYWRQQARLGLTYGLTVSHRTNFTNTKLGIAPTLGFRFTQLHLQTGITFYTHEPNLKNINIFFIALKFTLINKRDIDIKK